MILQQGNGKGALHGREHEGFTHIAGNDEIYGAIAKIAHSIEYYDLTLIMMVQLLYTLLLNRP